MLHDLLAAKIHEPWWRTLTEQTLWHDPRQDYVFLGNPASINLVPEHKRLINQPEHLGLPIGNLSSQFFANVYLNPLDQFVKHQLGIRHYSRYVDDFVLLHESPQYLNECLRQINDFLPTRLGARLNPKKTVLQPVDRGIDFVGHVIKPWRRTTRKRTVNHAISVIAKTPQEDLQSVANSYLGLIGQASHSHADRVRVCKAILRRGRSVSGDLSKTYGVPA